MRTLQTSGGDLDLVFFDGNGNVYTRVRLPPTADVERTEEPGDQFAVDESAAARTEWLEVDALPAVTVYDESGEVVEMDPRREPLVLAPAPYRIALSTPIQLIITVDAGVRILTEADRVRLEFDGDHDVEIGARFPTERPRTTVRTSPDVAEVFAAVSTFGSALRGFGPERSYPTMRAHPPRLEIADELDIPEVAQPPDTGFELLAPGTILNAAIAAPLAYYLGARLRPSRAPRLLYEDERVTRLRSGRGFAADCADLLQRTLLLDCLTRGAPDFDVPVEDRDRLADLVDIDWGRLSDLSGGERLRAYLDVPASGIREVMPAWERRAHVVPNERTIETLPYLAYDLVSIVPYRGVGGTQSAGGTMALPDGGARGSLRRRPERRRRGPHRPNPTPKGLFDLGTRSPIGLNRAFPATFHHRMQRSGGGDSVTVAVVCNDEKMLEEFEIAGETYGSREGFPVDVEQHERLTRDELAALLAEPIDYFHYIGHIDGAGFECRDGSLDAGRVGTVGVEAFFLNACDSVEQAIALVEGGAVGGIATKQAVVNSGAVRLGETIAALLIKGFPIGASLGFARSYNVIGHKYAIVGDPRLDIANSESGLPYRCEIDRLDDGRFDLTVRTYLSAAARHGSMSSFLLSEETPYYLNPTERTYTVTRGDILAFLDLEVVPVAMDGTLQWSTAVRDRLDEDGDSST